MDRRFPIEKFPVSKFKHFFGRETEKLKVRFLTGGACNSNYLVETSRQEKFVCRIHMRGSPQSEKRITQALQDIVPVPSYFWEFENLSVIEHIEGEHFTPSEKLVREAGRIIGRLSNISFERSGRIDSKGHVKGFEGWESYQKGLLGFLHNEAVKQYLSEDKISELEIILHEHASMFVDFDHCCNLVHGDFRPDNILVLGDSITGVIDWEFSHSGCSYMDIGNILRHIPNEWSSYLAVGLKEEGFELSEDWVFRSELMDLTSHLEFLTSDRSDEFKQTCVTKINHLIKRSREAKVTYMSDSNH